MRRQVLVGLVGWFGVCAAARAQEPALTSVLVTDGVPAPLYVAHAPGDADRIFIVSQNGQIRIVKCGRLLDRPFLDAQSVVRWGGEQGLLGLAFHPDYADDGQFFINYTGLQGDTVIARYHVSDNPDVAEPDGEVVLSFPQPHVNHNGGWIDFGPDGYLYIAAGDGGTSSSAQDASDLLGSLLRIDVDGDDFPGDPARNYAIPPDNPFVDTDGADEIWASGLRNPWRCAFDQLTGELYIGDVGSGDYEEIDVQPADDPGGANYGWACKEGFACFFYATCPCDDPTFVDPVYAYDHYEGCAIIGGEVYQGSAIPELQGTYFFSDICSASIWTFRYVDGKVTDFMDRTSELAPRDGPSIDSVSSFGRDASGELYICSLAGEVFKIVRADAAAPLVDSDPPDGAIDARRPFDPDGSNPTGWDSVELVFDGPVPALAPADFSVEQVGGDGGAPTVVDVVPVDTDRVRVDLSRPLSPGAWTTLASCDHGVYVRLGYLPADVNGDGVSSAIDILDFIDELNGVGPPRSDWSLDIDRSGVVNATDVLEIIDLLRGAGPYPAYNLARLP